MGMAVDFCACAQMGNAIITILVRFFSITSLERLLRIVRREAVVALFKEKLS